MILSTYVDDQYVFVIDINATLNERIKTTKVIGLNNVVHAYSSHHVVDFL